MQYFFLKCNKVQKGSNGSKIRCTNRLKDNWSFQWWFEGKYLKIFNPFESHQLITYQTFYINNLQIWHMEGRAKHKKYLMRAYHFLIAKNWLLIPPFPLHSQV